MVMLTYLFYLSGTLVMGVGQMMATISFNPGIFEFWNSWFILGILYYPPTILVFTLAFLGKESILKNFLFWVAILTPLTLFLFFTLKIPDLIIVNDFTKAKLYPWGYQVFATGKISPLVTLWYQVCFIPSIFMLVRFYRENRDKIIKKQALLLVIAIIIPYIGGVLTQGILPQFGIRIFPVGIPLNTINIILITYALFKFGSTTIDPFAIASSIIKIMHNAVVVINSKGNIILINPFTESFLGYRKDQLIGEGIKKILPEGYSSGEGEAMTATGQKIPVNIYTAGYTDNFSGYKATILTLADIQVLKKLHQDLQAEKANVEEKVKERTFELKEEHARLSASINSLSVGFILVDQSLNIFTANGSSTKILFKDGPPHQVTFSAISGRLKNSIDLELEVKKCIKEKKIIDFKEIRFGTFFLRIILTPISLGETIIGCAILIEDITEEKVIARSKDEFLSLASHELRTPLTAIRGYASVLEQSGLLKKDPQVKNAVGVIDNSVVRLINIVNDFIDVYELEQQDMIFKKDKVDMPALITKVLKEYKALAEEKNLYLKFTGNQQTPKVLGDFNRIRQVIANLISNGIKYTNTGGIDIGIKKEDKFLRIVVSDTGTGIKPELQKFLFRKFQQAVENIYTREGVQKGIGLGLYIAKLMVEGMGGKIQLDSSNKEKGSAFSFTLPYA